MIVLKNLYRVILREFRIIFMHKRYLLCMVAVPWICALFFTTLMESGQPLDMPVGVVDNDNTSTTRKLTRMLDSFQSSRVVAHYPTAAEARWAMQRGEIYGFMYFPKNTTSDLLAQRQPTISFYYSSTSMTAGSLIFKDMKTMTTLGTAAVAQSVMTAKGMRPEIIKAVLQPIALDTHYIGNPMTNYNAYLSNFFVPGCLLLFIFLLTPYSFGTELKFGTSKEFMAKAGDNSFVAIIGKVLPHTVIYLFVMFAIMTYMYGYLHFPAPGGYKRLMLLGVLSVLGTQGLSLTIFGMCHTLRMGMSICSLMGVLSFSMVGCAYPVFAMDAPLQSLAWLFPLRHYYLIYQISIFNTYPLSSVYANIACLIIFAALPLLVAGRIGNAMRRAVHFI